MEFDHYKLHKIQLGDLDPNKIMGLRRHIEEDIIPFVLSKEFVFWDSSTSPFEQPNVILQGKNFTVALINLSRGTSYPQDFLFALYRESDNPLIWMMDPLDKQTPLTQAYNGYIADNERVRIHYLLQALLLTKRYFTSQNGNYGVEEDHFLNINPIANTSSFLMNPELFPAA